MTTPPDSLKGNNTVDVEEARKVSEEIRDVSGNLYPWAKNELLEAESVGEISLPQVWMRGIRNGLDHFAAAVTHHHDGRLVEAKNSLFESRRLFQLSAHEGWLLAASYLTLRLDRSLRSIRTTGEVARANTNLNTAVKLLKDSRASYSTDRAGATDKARSAAKLAKEGLDIIQTGSDTGLIFVIGAVVGITILVAYLLLRSL